MRKALLKRISSTICHLYIELGYYDSCLAFNLYFLSMDTINYFLLVFQVLVWQEFHLGNEILHEFVIVGHCHISSFSRLLPSNNHTFLTISGAHSYVHPNVFLFASFSVAVQRRSWGVRGNRSRSESRLTDTIHYNVEEDWGL